MLAQLHNTPSLPPEQPLLIVRVRGQRSEVRLGSEEVVALHLNHFRFIDLGLPIEIDGRFAMWKTVAYYCASCCCITVVCVTADWLVFRFDAFQKYPILRAVTDNLTHGLVGCWCWATSAIFLGWGKYTAHECLLCFAVACAVDADHFIEARSLSFKVSVESTTLASIVEAIVTSPQLHAAPSHVGFPLHSSYRIRTAPYSSSIRCCRSAVQLVWVEQIVKHLVLSPRLGGWGIKCDSCMG